jgi:hypothetical protein
MSDAPAPFLGPETQEIRLLLANGNSFDTTVPAGEEAFFTWHASIKGQGFMLTTTKDMLIPYHAIVAMLRGQALANHRALITQMSATMALAAMQINPDTRAN